MRFIVTHPSSLRRKAALHVVRILFDRLTLWLAPIVPFTMEEAWLQRRPEAEIRTFGAIC